MVPFAALSVHSPTGAALVLWYVKDLQDSNWVTDLSPVPVVVILLTCALERVVPL